MAEKVEELEEKGVIIIQKNVRIETNDDKIFMVGNFVVQAKAQLKKYTPKKPVITPNEVTE